MPRTGVALSGGGHRATLFGIGVLQYLADAGVNREVVSISSVSGGSIANGFVGQQVDYGDVDGDKFQAAVTEPICRQIATKGTLFGARLTKLYLAALVLGGLAAVVAPWFLPIAWYWRVAVFVVAVVLVAQLAWLRGRVCAAAFRSTLFTVDGRATPLSALARSVDHVICTTDLRSGDHVYFAGDLVYGYRFGVGVPGDLDLATAAHASAALPGAFPPVHLPAGRHRFTGAPPTPGLDAPPDDLVLVDGGVYDNMADQWGANHADREDRLPPRYAGRSPERLVVANASAGSVWSPYRSGHVPVLRELTALLRDKGILYDNTTAHRRRALVERFEQSFRTGEGQTGCYVGIEQSPLRVAERHRTADAEWPDRAQRARAVIDALGADADAWTATARWSAGVGTHLSKMPPDDVARLVHHAYVVTMCNCHVVLGAPLLPVPEVARFRP
jgi:NTE family protein